jgi:hypothetical protein
MKMTDQFQPPIEKKVEDETVGTESAQKRIEQVAEKAAEKSSNREKEFGKEHNVFSK